MPGMTKKSGEIGLIFASIYKSTKNACYIKEIVFFLLSSLKAPPTPKSPFAAFSSSGRNFCSPSILLANIYLIQWIKTDTVKQSRNKRLLNWEIKINLLICFLFGILFIIHKNNGRL